MEVARKELLAWLENNIEYHGFSPEEVEEMVNTWIDLIIHPPGEDNYGSLMFDDDLWHVYPTSVVHLDMNGVLGIVLPEAEDMYKDFLNLCNMSESDLIYHTLSDEPICIKVVS
jgi:hypothetical protein